MNPLSWIEPAFTAETLNVPPQLRTMINREKQKQSPIYLLDAQGSLEVTKEMQRQFPKHHVMAFAQRQDNDGVICVVLADEIYARGHTLVLHWDAWPGTEIDDEYPSLGEWAKSAEEEIAERISMGWDAPE